MRMAMAIVCMLLACGDHSQAQNDGELGGHCYPNGTCNVGLSCSGGLCGVSDAAIDAPAIDAAIDAAGDAAIDASVCADDSAYEPNDTLQTAFDTGVDATKSLTLASLSICPAGDEDLYAVQITTSSENLEMIVDFGPGITLQGAILNSGGIPIANASVVTGMPARRRAYAPNLPIGVYYLKVAAGAAGTNDYQLAIAVTGP